jgi:flagellar motor switch protein FliN/FliY
VDVQARGSSPRRPAPRAPVYQEPEDPTILYDVPLVVEAEMGRTTKSVREILKIAQGSVIELDKDQGEPVDLYVNGKLIARGEIVEIDGNYGVRITELIY